MEEGGESEVARNSRMSWKDPELLKILLEECIKEVNAHGREGSTLKPSSWRRVQETFKKTYGIELTLKQLKNRFDYTKSKYAMWCRLKNKTGNVYDASTNRFNLTKEEWEQEKLINPKIEILKNSPLLWPDLCVAIYDGFVATGADAWGPSSKISRTMPEHVEELGDFGQNETDGSGPIGSTPAPSSPDPSHAPPPAPSHAPPPAASVSVTQGASSSRPKKSRRTNQGGNTDLDAKISLAIDKLVNQSDGGASVAECKAKLDSLEIDGSLRKYAVAIFTQGPGFRDGWMSLNEADDIPGWIEIMARQLRFMP